MCACVHVWMCACVQKGEQYLPSVAAFPFGGLISLAISTRH